MNLDPNTRVFGNISYIDPLTMTQSLVYYKVTIDTPIADEDLIMMVKPTNRISDPDIFISKINPFPNSFENSEWVCNAFICVINSKNIEPNTTFMSESVAFKLSIFLIG